MESNHDAIRFDWRALERSIWHSRIAGKNSGVFVSDKKSDIKLEQRTQIALAIGAQEMSGMNGGF